MRIKFIGKWTDLKPMGYKFQKLYARNYICYHQEEMWIWKKGTELEIADNYDKSFIILQYFINNGFKMPKYNTLVINRIDDIFEDLDWEKHDFMFISLRLEEEQGKKLSKEEYQTMYKEHREKYKEVTISNKSLELLKELYEKKMIEIG